MDDTTVDPGCPIHGDGTPICTCGELEALDRLRAERDTLTASIQTALAIHQPCDCGDDGDCCHACARESYPCATAAALARVVLADHTQEQ